MKKAFMHLTNYSLNKYADEYIEEPENILEPNGGSKRTLEALWKDIMNKKGGVKTARELKKSIYQTCSGTLSVFLNMIQHAANPLSRTDFKAKPFQIFGFDILIDNNMKAWILEINDNPSFNIMLCKEGNGCLHKDCPQSKVDLHVKKSLFNDAIMLMM